MNRTIAAALVIAASAAGNAFADDITIDNTPFTSTATRAEVVAQLHAFRSAGSNPWADDHDQLAGFSSSKSRAQVSAEYIASRDQVAALNGEDSGSTYLAQNGGGNAVAIHLAGQSVAAE